MERRGKINEITQGEGRGDRERERRRRGGQKQEGRKDGRRKKENDMGRGGLKTRSLSLVPAVQYSTRQ